MGTPSPRFRINWNYPYPPNSCTYSSQRNNSRYPQPVVHKCIYTNQCYLAESKARRATEPQSIVITATPNQRTVRLKQQTEIASLEVRQPSPILTHILPTSSNMPDTHKSYTLTGYKKVDRANYCNHCIGHINNSEIKILVDTGATLSLISKELVVKLNLREAILDIPIQLSTASEQILTAKTSIS